MATFWSISLVNAILASVVFLGIKISGFRIAPSAPIPARSAILLPDPGTGKEISLSAEFYDV
jgi:hypothetical protein